MNPGAHITKIDLAGLRVARAIIRRHAPLIDAALVVFGRADGCACIVEALSHIIEDDFRSPETPGGS
jgi:hypothetical protein